MAGEFYGRSYELDWGQNVDGTPIGDFGNLYYHFDGASETIAAGQSFTATAWPYPRGELAGIDELEISWAIETGPASNGTLELLSGLDPAGDMSPTHATEPIGNTHVIGARTAALRTSSITAQDLYRGDADPLAWIKCTEGSVEIVQIKLRAWPVGGARGAWTRGPAFGGEGGSAPYAHDMVIRDSPQVPELEDAWALGVGLMGSVGGQKVTWRRTSGYDSTFHLKHSSTSAPFQPFARIFVTSTVYVPTLPAATTSPAPNAGIDPREIQWETESQIRAIGGGPVLPTVLGWRPVAITQSNIEGHVALSSCSFDIPGATPFVAPAVQAPAGINQIYLNAGERREVTPPSDGPFVVTGYPRLYFEEPTGFTLDSSRGSLGPAMTDLLYPEHLYFDPSLPWADDAKPTPRFFWKDDLDQWRVIGPGKPADDLVLFKIKTAMGIYSEPRPGDEPGSGAHPLRVKVDTGYGADSWDTPVWMEPDY